VGAVEPAGERSVAFAVALPPDENETERRRTMATSPALSPLRRARLGLVLVLAAALGILVPALPSSAEEPQTAAEAAALVAGKAHELEKVTEQFNEARETLKGQQAAAQKAAKQLKKAQKQLARAQQAVRGIARSAYTGEGLSTFSALMTSDSADQFVDRMGVLQMVAGHQNELLDSAASANVSAAQAKATAEKAAGAAQKTYDKVAAQQSALEAQIDEYRSLYDKLDAAEKQAAVAAAAHDTARASRADRGTTESFSTNVVAGSQAAQVVVDTAMAQRGKPYVWAAAGPGSFDCSGLSLYAYAAAGISLPHSSAMQSQMGTQVSRSELRPGDLVFFYSPVSHVGIYIGNGQMVHAPTFGDVVKVAPIDAMGSYSHGMRLIN
jgi:peptidoglycan DL-endopeptidase CwlO